MDDVDQITAAWGGVQQRHVEAGLARTRAALAGPASSGVCADCGSPIKPARLAAVPQARRCAECQKDHEGTRG